MNKDQFQGNWNEIKGKVKEKWGKLTDNDLTQISGKRDQLLGLIQKKYGYAREKAEEEIRHFEQHHVNTSKNTHVNEENLEFRKHTQDKHRM